MVKKGTIPMKLHFRINTVINTTVCGIALAGGLFAIRARADVWDKKTIVTVDQPIQVEETFLPSGTYVFRLLDSSSDRHVVQIFNGDQTQIINTVLAIPNYRLRPSGHSQFTFWETPPGNAKAVRAWFYPGDNFGQEFRYPKRVHALEVAAAVPAPAPPPPVTQPETKAEETQPEQQPVEMAQTAPPAANPAPAPQPEAQPAPPPEPPPANLPKTASLYPLVGLGGLFSLGLYGFLRLKRLV
jgi:hypothetical protein